ncbi:MAG: diaminohydroxyphosphoribosylaminopyrimidine deaminase [Actinobacteria bacterium]|nr:diaminohydroxyphosphoribosylaminopyrimidine deaminase [Actinomycetota bacterium]
MLVQSKDLEHLVGHLNAKELNHVLVEAGPTLGSAMLVAGLIDELIIYQAPSLLGSGKQFFSFDNPSTITNQMRLDHISTDVLDGDVPRNNL